MSELKRELTREELIERWGMARNKAKILKEKLLKKQRVIDRLDQVIKDKDQKIGSLMRALKRARETEDRMQLELEKAKAAEKVAKMLEDAEDE